GRAVADPDPAQATAEAARAEMAAPGPDASSAPDGAVATATKEGKGRLKAVPAAPFKKLKMKVSEVEANPAKAPKPVTGKNAGGNGKASKALAKAKGFIVTKGGKTDDAPAEEAKAEAPEAAADPPAPSRPPLPELKSDPQSAPAADSGLGELEDLDAIDGVGGEPGANRGKVDLRTRRVKLPPKRQGSTIREVRDVYEGGEEGKAAPGEVSTLPPAPVPMAAPGAPAENNEDGVAFETIEPGAGESGDLRTSIEELQAAADFDPKNQTELALEGGPKGRFEGEEPNMIDGEDLDVPPFLRRQS
ncbi:MAG: hypothetical protein HKN82_11610, partial [Akkermansiaceae bacterium]|nr:hypothetical protein [Akkermansiaceae bacterium]